MAITLQKGQGKVEQVEGEWEKEKEVIFQHENVSPEWKTWNHDDFSRNWQKDYSV